MSRITLQGPQNCRDLTGITARDGAVIHPGRVFRSDALGPATDADLTVLADRKVGTVIDFRTDPEVDRGPDRLPPGARYLRLPIDAGDIGAILSGGDALPVGDALADTMRTINRQFVTVAAFREQFATALRVVAGAGHAVLYHCTAGKDRTGWMTTIVLSVLGVDRDTVIEDYLASNAYVAGELNAELAPLVEAGLLPSVEAAAPVVYQDRSYLQAGFDQADHTYGGMENYLREGLGFAEPDLIALRKHLIDG